MIAVLLNPKFRAILLIYIGEPDSEQSPTSLRNRLESSGQGNALRLFDSLCGLGSVRPDILSQ